jgi:hypothetical protein
MDRPLVCPRSNERAFFSPSCPSASPRVGGLFPWFIWPTRRRASPVRTWPWSSRGLCRRTPGVPVRCSSFSWLGFPVSGSGSRDGGLETGGGGAILSLSRRESGWGEGRDTDGPPSAPAAPSCRACRVQSLAPAGPASSPRAIRQSPLRPGISFHSRPAFPYRRLSSSRCRLTSRPCGPARAPQWHRHKCLC